MKKILSATLSIFLFAFYFNVSNVGAACLNTLDDNTYYIETTIEDGARPFTLFAQFTARTVTKTKTTTVKSSDGTSLWSVSITGTFTYDGTTSKCISCSHNAVSYVDSWRIKSVTSQKSGNSATAIAIARHMSGNIANEYSQAVTITCSKNGTVS